MELKPSHEMFCQELVRQGGQQARAYLAVYPNSTPDSARHSSTLLLTKIDIRHRVSELMEAQGLGISELNKKLKDMLNAKRVSYYRNGEPVQYRDDVKTQMEALRIAYRIHGLLGHNSPDGIEVFLSPEQLELLEKENGKTIS